MKFFKKLLKGKKENKNHKKSDILSVDYVNPLIKLIYDDRLNRIKEWKNRYSRKEYPYKVAINTVYQLMTLIEMWDFILKCFNGKKTFNNFEEAYSFVQRTSGEIALTKIIHLVESKLKLGGRISILDVDILNNFINLAQNGDSESLKQVERCYLWYTGAVELIYAYAAFGLMGLDKMSSIQQILSVIVGGNPDIIDEALIIFGTNTELYYKKLQIF